MSPLKGTAQRKLMVVFTLKVSEAAVNTIIASMGGGVFSVAISLGINRLLKRSSKYDVGTIVTGVLGSLVSITSICTLCLPWEAFIIGSIAPFITSATELLLLRLRVDDPVGVIPVHLSCAIWGLVTVGLFIPADTNPLRSGEGGLFKTGQAYMLGIQVLTVVIIAVWTAILSFIFLKILALTIGIRLSKDEEELGADATEHGTMQIFHLSAGPKHISAQSRNKSKVFPNAVIKPENNVSNSVTTQNRMNEIMSNSANTQNRMNEIMIEFFTTCEKLDMSVTLSNRSSDSITFEITSKPSDTQNCLQVSELDSVITNGL